MTILTTKYHTELADLFIDNVSSNNYYVFISRSEPWDDSDTAVVTADDSVYQTEQDVYAYMLYGKKIESDNVINGIPNNPWTNNTFYPCYNQNVDTSNSLIYVINSSNDVYKCIYNNNTNSVYQPSYANAHSTQQTSDGYIWKYMYSVNSAVSAFTNQNYIPVVSDPNVVGNATPGSIDIVQMSAKGNNFTVSANGNIVGQTNTTVIQLPNTFSNSSGYYQNSSIYIASNGFVSEISAYNGSTFTATLENPLPANTFTGAAFSIGPTVKITGDGVGVIAFATVNSTTSTVENISVVNTGSDYSFANVSVYANNLYGSGVVANAIISPILGHGSNPIEELGGSFVIINTINGNLVTEQLYFPAYGTFRTAGIIKNPTFANVAPYRSNSSNYGLRFNHTVRATVNNANFDIDETVMQGSNAAVVFSTNNEIDLAISTSAGTFALGQKVTDSNTGAFGFVTFANSTYLQLTSVSNTSFYAGDLLSSGVGGGNGSVSTVYPVVVLNDIYGNFSNSGNIVGQTSLNTANVYSVINQDLVRNSGKVVYYENFLPVTKSANSAESINIVIEF